MSPVKCLRVVAVIAVLVAAAASTDLPNQNQSQPGPTPVLVELFTSEGCSSCPPADRLLQMLDHHPEVQNTDAIVLSEHVDYWNHDGWRDPFSSAFFSQRQRSYAARFGLDDVYTPQMVVDGRAQFVGSDSRQAHDAIAGSASAPKIPVHMSPVTVDGRILKFRVDVGGTLTSGAKQPEVYVVLAYESATSQVSAGENSGRRLTHVAVARDFTKVGVISSTGHFSGEVQLKLSDDLRPGNIRVITYLQEPGQGAVLGAAIQHVPQVSASQYIRHLSAP